MASRRRSAWLLVAISACGRVAFDPRVDAAGDAPPVGCQHTFCDDFDRATGLADGWTSSAGSDLSLDQGSLRVAFPPTVADSEYLEIDLAPVAQTSARYAFDMDLETTDMTAETDLATLAWLTPPPGCTVLGFFIVRTRAFTPPMLVLQETYAGCASNIDDPIPAPPGFHHYEVDVAFGSTGHVTVLVDGVVAVDRVPAAAVPASQLTFRLGAPSIQDAEQPWLIHYDNLAIDLE